MFFNQISVRSLLLESILHLKLIWMYFIKYFSPAMQSPVVSKVIWLF